MKTIKNFIRKTDKRILLESFILGGVALIIVFMILHYMQFGFVYQINPEGFSK